METGKDLIGRFRVICSTLAALAIPTTIWGSDFFALVSFGILFATMLLGWSVKDEITLAEYLVWVGVLVLGLLHLRQELVSPQAYTMSWFTENRAKLLVPTLAGAVTVGMSTRLVLDFAISGYRRLKG
ncbi:hypothetical protein [Roseibium sp.]|uniref:hypothetical protein n=1 Tax=Roseibium sp. TaxID=1936156 RepID=UPI003B50778E